MYSEKLEKLIEHALADGVLTEKEKQVLMKAAEAEGIDLDEFEIVLEARLYEKTQQQAENPVADKQSESDDNLTGGKQKSSNFISSNPVLWKIILCLAIAVGSIVVLKMVLCGGPTAKQLEQQVENNLRQFTELGTVEYVVSKIVKADDNATWYKFGDRKIIFTCKANLKAGIDLSELPKDSIRVDAGQKSISLVLPKAKLLSYSMKPDDIHLVYEKTALVRSSFSSAERDNVMAQGEKNIKESIVELGILTDAEKNAKMFLETFLKQTGYNQINIKFTKN